MRFSCLRSTVWIDEEADEYRLSNISQNGSEHRLSLFRSLCITISGHHTFYRMVKLQHRVERLRCPLRLLECFHNLIVTRRELVQTDEGRREKRLELD